MVPGGLFDAEERLRWLSASCDLLDRLLAVVGLTSATRHDGSQLGAVAVPENTGSGVWADAAYRCKANLDALEHRGLRPDTRQPQVKPSAAG